MEQSFVDEIKKKTSLVKFVVNTDTATDIISYLYKETERQKSEIDIIKKKLEDMNSDSSNNNTSNQNKYDQLSERINELSTQMNKKIEDFNTKTNNLIKEKINDINMKTDSLSKKYCTGDNSQSTFSEFLHQLNLLRNELQTLRRNTSEILGVDEKELNKSKPNRNSKVESSNQNSDSESNKTIPNTPQSSKINNLQQTPIQQSQIDSPQIKKEQISLKEINDQINQLKEEIKLIKQMKQENISSNYTVTTNNNNSNNLNNTDTLNNSYKTNNNTHNNANNDSNMPTTNNDNSNYNNNYNNNNNNSDKSSSKVTTRIIKKREKREIKDFKDQEVEVKLTNDSENLRSEENTKSNTDLSNLKIEDLTSLYQEIEKLKQTVDEQANQLKKIEATTKNDQISLDDYIQEILQSAMKCDSESQKLTNDYKNLQNLLINSIQEIKERMDSMLDQFNDMATKEEVMAAFSEIINPKTPQNGTSIGVSKCKYKCLACGRTKPSVISATDSNLSEILHYHPLNTKSEIFKPGAKVTLLNKDVPVISRSQIQLKDSATPRRPKTCRS